MHAQVLRCINQRTKFETPSFTDYKNMIGVQTLKIGSRDPDLGARRAESSIDR